MMTGIYYYYIIEPVQTTLTNTSQTVDLFVLFVITFKSAFKLSLFLPPIHCWPINFLPPFPQTHFTILNDSKNYS